jgi:hypothetical protein
MNVFVLGRKNVRCKLAVLTDLSSVQLCLMCRTKEAVFYGALPAWPMWNYVEQELVPLHSGHLPPSPQSGHWGFSLLAVSKKDKPDSEHLRTAQAGTCSYGSVYIDIVLHFPFSNTVSWNTPKMVYLHSIDCCCYFLG